VVVDVAVLGTRREREAIRRKIGGVDGAEVTVHLDELVAKDNVVHLHFEAARALVRRRHVSGVLTAREDAVELLVAVAVEERADRG